MAELRGRLEELEQRLERAEAALRNGHPWGPRIPAVPMTFEDVAVHFSRQEWAELDDEQRDLYRGVMEDNYEMLMSLYCDLSKPDLVAQMEGEELSMLVESNLTTEDVSQPPAAVEPECLSCVSDDGLMEMKIQEPCKKNPLHLEDRSSPLVAVCEENCLHLEDRNSPTVAVCEEKSQHLEDRNSPTVAVCEEKTQQLEDRNSPVVAAIYSASHVPPEATAVPVDLSQPTPSPSCPVTTQCHEAVILNWCPSPPPAADAEVGIPMEVPPEEVTDKKPRVPEMPSKALEEEENVKDAGNASPATAVDAPEEAGKEMPGVCGAMVQADPSTGSPGEPVEGRTATFQRGSSREKSYSCLVCRKKFLLKINLLIHQRSHSNDTPYACPHCNRTFMSKRKIGRHLRARALKGFCQPPEAEECSSRAPCPASQPHPATCETVWGKPNPSRCPLSPGKIMYTCNDCMENFSSQSFLILHQRHHTKRHCILCPCCNRSFTWASDFVRHQWSDTGGRPYQCGICQKTFKRRYHLSVHQRIHVRQERPCPHRDQLPMPAAPV
ncbi:zinc finger protein 69 homolog B-like isoform X2 [Pogoniulus pusillus]|uniref:zinc finger protein 69 homolog B-like isoform X2 n=1 Tax=Pogoniulus pusillus TaxID=488313 RepID=UPI0030B96B84